MRVLFFTDWRIQPIYLIEKIAKKYGPIDVIVYGGDDLSRFISHNIDSEKLQEIRKHCQYKRLSPNLSNPEIMVDLLSNELGPPVIKPNFKRGIWTFQRILNLFRGKAENKFQTLSGVTTNGVLAIAGNDDYHEDRSILDVAGVTNLHVSPKLVGDYGFIGIEGSITDGMINKIGNIFTPDNKVISHLQKQMKHLNVPPENLIIVSHTPPAGCLDISIRFGFGKIGSSSLASFVQEVQPKLVLCGHCHASGGNTIRLNNTLVVNAASDDKDVKRSHIAIIDIEAAKKTKIEWAPITGVLFIPSIGYERTKQLENVGITTCEELFAADDLVIKQALGWGTKGLRNIRTFQKAMQNNTIEWLPGKPIEIPKTLIFYDVETGVRSHPDAWIISALSYRDMKFHQIVVPEENAKLREAMYLEFFEFINQYREKVLCAWTHENFDKRSIAKGLHKYLPNYSKKWDAMPHFDLFNSIHRRIVFPLPNKQLKTLSLWCGYTIKDPSIELMNGRQVGLAYDDYLAKGTVLDIDKIREYNRHDVFRMAHLIDWLSKQEDPFNPIREQNDK